MIQHTFELKNNGSLKFWVNKEGEICFSQDEKVTVINHQDSVELVRLLSVKIEQHVDYEKEKNSWINKIFRKKS